MTGRRRQVVVVGGGISGLAAAWAAARAAPRVPGGFDVLVLEGAEEVGGKARTVRRDGWLVECGPSSFASGYDTIAALADAVGMREALIEADRVASRRYIHLDGRLREVSASPFALVRSGLLTVRGALRLALEPVIPKRAGGDDADDESVWAFAARRVGAEVADRLVRPAILGVCAAEAERLSMRAAFPRLAHLERDHGSLLRGMAARRRVTVGGAPRRGLWSFRDGMQSLPLALARRGGFQVRTGCEVTSLHHDDDGWQVMVAGGAPMRADAVILSADPRRSAHLLRAVAPDAAEALAEIRSPGIATVSLGYGADSRGRVPPGFGVLIARNEGYRMLGNVFDSQLFPGRAPEGHVLVRALLGGATDEGLVDLPETALMELARQEVARLYGLRASPVFEQLAIVPSAIPWYDIGHPERVARVDRAIAPLTGLALTGFGLRGLSFPDAAADGIRVGGRIAETLATMSRVFG